MADVMKDLQTALVEVQSKKKVFDAASLAVQKASEDYQFAITTVRNLKLKLDEQVNNQLLNVGVDLPDSRVSQSS